MITYTEALQKCNDLVREISLEAEVVDITESTGRILAQNIYTDIPSPSFRTSTMDGLAIRYEAGIISWNILGIAGAGKEYPMVIEGSSSAIEIMTGAKVPDFTDTVIPLEDYELEGSTCKLNPEVKIKRGVNIREVGCEKQLGELVVSLGKKITPKVISVLAACGKKKVSVQRKIKVGLLTTGDELVDIDAPLSEGKIRGTNSYFLNSALSQIGCEVVDYGAIIDDITLLHGSIKSILNTEIDILITSGAVSKGKYDYLPEVFSSCGVEEVFHGVRIKPGKPIFAGRYQSAKHNKIIFGLPGNPVSASVNFEIFIKPFVCGVYHLTNDEFFSAKMKIKFSKEDKKRHFVRAKVLVENGEIYVEPFLKQSSANLFDYADAECLIIVEEDITVLESGTTVKCIKI